MKQLYTVTHTYEYGADTHLLRADHFPTQEEAIAAFGMDYEPARGEEIEINAVTRPPPVEGTEPEHRLVMHARRRLRRDRRPDIIAEVSAAEPWLS